ncbi:MAG TPA: GMC family oxidoreductase [Solirubrobacteraceae bacterium]|jgi:choline dehydrogenase-like flavoprotein
MHINAKSLPPRATLAAEIAIVGSGPAGIALALELADAGHQVLLIESGGSSYSRDAQHLGDTVGGDALHAPMSMATRRQVGGTSNLWSGRCVPFDPIDFEPREIVGDAGWPVSYAELETYFARACEWFRCGEPVFDVRSVPSLAGDELIPGWPGGDICDTALERWSLPTNFGRLYGARLRSSPLVTLVSELTCTEIVCRADAQSVDHLRAHTQTGSEVRVRAKRYVLAAGGVESTRLLFASTRHHPDGIGSHSGHLGRWYMNHVGVSIARAHFDTPPEATIYGFERDDEGVYVRRRFTFSREFLIEHRLPNVAMWIENPDMRDPSHENGILSIIYLILASPLGPYVISEGIRRSKLDTGSPASTWAHVRNIVLQLPATVRFALAFGYGGLFKPGRKVPGFVVSSPTNVYPLYYQAEHLPHPDSHIAPTAERDALGVPRVRTHLHFGEEDIRSVIRAHEYFDDYLRRSGLGRLEYLFEDREEGVRGQLLDGYHQAGTTRMSERPEDGVLNPDLAVHGFEDLYVASGSALVTSGQANTTFMIVVLALRLAAHLDRALRLHERA